MYAVRNFWHEAFKDFSNIYSLHVPMWHIIIQVIHVIKQSLRPKTVEDMHGFLDYAAKIR